MRLFLAFVLLALSGLTINLSAYGRDANPKLCATQPESNPAKCPA